MKTIEEIRQLRISKLVESCGGSITNLAKILGKDYAQVWQWVNRPIASNTGNKRSIGSRSARFIEQKFNKKPGWMDSLND